MKVVFTNQSFESLQELESFLSNDLKWPDEKVVGLRKRLLDKAEELVSNFNHYQKEEYLSHLGKNHQRVIEVFCKIIYRVQGEHIYITDFFDTRQDPKKMKE